MKQAKLFRKIGKNIVKCLACSWYCRILPNNLGICATRLNKNGVLYSLVYGKAIGLHLDPVEKKPLYHFLPGAKFLSFGTLGCNFGCLFCQNWEMSQTNKDQEIRQEDKLIKLIDALSTDINPAEIVDLALNQHADGIAYTYNEPAIFAEYTLDTAKIARKKGLKNIYVSNGFESVETFNYVKDYFDGINIDLKSFRNEFYQQICKAKITPVLENIKKFFAAGIETEITTLIIPGQNDSKEELTEIADFLASISKDIPWHISAFYPAYKMTNIPPTPYETLIKTYMIGKKAGLKYVYLGNVSDVKNLSTYCPECQTLLIERKGYHVELKNFDSAKGMCKKCHEKIYGVWN